MAEDRGEAALPPADLARRVLSLRAVPKGGPWWRIHRVGAGPCHFSEDASNRFSAHGLGVLYLATADVTAFWEVFWDDLGTRPPGERRISHARLNARAVCSASLQRPVAVFDATDPRSLKAVSAPTATFSGPYAVCQAWAGALATHPSEPGGLLYPSARHKDGVCLALFAARVACKDLRFGAGTRVGDRAQILDDIARDDVQVLYDGDGV